MTANDNTLQAMIRDPSTYFDTPEAVLCSTGLDKEEKIAILESWLVDEQELAKATEENMGDSNNNRLTDVSKALRSLRDD